MSKENPPILEGLLPALLEAATRTGARILEDWGKTPDVTRKVDGSPVTPTDDAAEAMMIAALNQLDSHKIVAEEAVFRGHVPTLSANDAFWLVDALDGTRDFITGGKDFTVNAALIQNGQPVAGIVHAPAFGITWYASEGQGAFRVFDGKTTRMAMRAAPESGLHLLAGKRASEPTLLEPFIGQQIIAGREQRSSSLKFCLVAEGAADLYPRLGETYEWDTAAGDIVLRESGGMIMDIVTMQPIAYGKADRGFINNGFIAGAKSMLRIAAL